MKTKVKFVAIDTIDIYNFQDFLNEQARNGWLFAGIKWQLLKFEYKPDNQLYYSVVYEDFKVFVDQQDLNDEQKFNDLAFELDYKFEHKVNQHLSIYSSFSETPMYSEQEIDTQLNKKLAVKSMPQQFLGILLYLYLFYSFNKLKIYHLTDNINLILNLIFGFVCILMIIKFIRTIRFYFGQLRWKSIKWNTLSTDPLTAGTLLIFVPTFLLFILKRTGMPWYFMFIFIITPISYFILYNWIRKKSWSKRTKWISYGIGLAVLLFVLLIGSNMFMFNDILNNPDSFRDTETTGIAYLDELNQRDDCRVFYNSESILGKYISIYCSEEHYSIVQSNNDWIIKLLSRDLLSKENINYDELRPDVVTKINNEIVYRGQNFTIIGNKGIPDQLITEVASKK